MPSPGASVDARAVMTWTAAQPEPGAGTALAASLEAATPTAAPAMTAAVIQRAIRERLSTGHLPTSRVTPGVAVLGVPETMYLHLKCRIHRLRWAGKSRRQLGMPLTICQNAQLWSAANV